MRPFLIASLFTAAVLVFPLSATAQVPFHVETVDSTGDTGFGASIALDSQGRPYIAYIDRQSHAVRCTAKTSGTWTALPGQPPYGDDRTGAALVLDAADSPGIAHIGRFHRRVNGAWTTEDMGGYGPWFSTVAQDAAGGLQGVTIWSWGSGLYEGYVSFTERVGDAWSDFVFDDGTFLPTDPHASIVIDRNGDPHISVTPTAGDSVRYWRRTNSAWSRVMFTPGAWSSIALDEQGSPRIAYYDTVARDLVLAFQENGAWILVPLDQTGDVGMYASQRIRDGVSHITYYAKSSGDLRYAAFNPSAGRPPIIQTVDSAGDVGTWTSIALDQYGRPHIAYRDGGNGHLKYATAAVDVPVEKRSVGSVKWLYRR